MNRRISLSSHETRQATELWFIALQGGNNILANKKSDMNTNLVSVIEMSSLGIEHDLSLALEKPNPCTRYITGLCVPTQWINTRLKY